MRGMILACLVAAGFVFSLQAVSPTESAFFKAIQGRWSGSGELTDQEGKVTPIQENWTGEFTEEGSFVMSGNRQFGEDSQEFSWEFSLNAATELIECAYWHTGMDEKLVFQVSLDDEGVELSTPFGEPGGELLVANRLSEEGIDGLVEFKNPNGDIIIGGPVTHQRED